MLMPDAHLHFDPTTLVGCVLQPVILLLAVILAWPVDHLRAWPARLLLAAPMMALLLAAGFCRRDAGFPRVSAGSAGDPAGVLGRLPADRWSVGAGDCGWYPRGVGRGSMGACA